MERETDNGFQVYKKLIISQLEQLKKSLEEIQGDIREMQIDIALLNHKNSVWSGIISAITTAALLGAAYFLRLVH